jgi:prevent-host-death family protein
MTEVGTLEAKNQLSSLLDRVIEGEEVVITRHGKPVAKLVAIDKPSGRSTETQRVIDATHALRNSIKSKGKPVPWDELKKDRKSVV